MAWHCLSCVSVCGRARSKIEICTCNEYGEEVNRNKSTQLWVYIIANASCKFEYYCIYFAAAKV